MNACCATSGSLSALFALVTLLVAPTMGCAGHRAPLAAAPAGTSPSDTAAAPDSGSQARAPDRGFARPSDGAATGLPPAPGPGGEEPTPDKALPELKVQALGMHIGGGDNSPEGKAPFHRALERQFPAFLHCYRLVDDAWTGGSFGVDLKIPRAGGAPTLEQPRTKIRGGGFRECMIAAFGNVQFEKPKAGPTVVSYSVMFTLGAGKPR